MEVGEGVANDRAAGTRLRFTIGLSAATVLGALIRFTYVMTDRRPIIGGDGFDYHGSALRLADGLGYTYFFVDVGTPNAHHPPGWVSILGLVSWLGGRTDQAHQLVGVLIGLGVVVLAGLIGRRYFDARIGVIAAVIAAVYPGFWVLEGNILSEPVGLLILGFFTLMIIDLRDAPTIGRTVAIGAVCGVLGLVRSEQVAVLVVIVGPVLLTATSLALRDRLLRIVLAIVACAAVLAPWTVYNFTRFEEPVLLSTNSGALLLTGNCPPGTFSGERLGYYDNSCLFRLRQRHRSDDRSQISSLAQAEGLRNMLANLERLPVAIPARLGRMVGVFRPSQTVEFVAAWMRTDTRPIWAWVVSYWLLIPLAVVGAVRARRSRRFLLPLVGPLIIVAFGVVISYGEPRYHTPSDLGVVVLAAAGTSLILGTLHRSIRDRRLAATARHPRRRPANN